MTSSSGILPRICEVTAKQGIYAIILVVPLFFWPTSYAPFDIPKVALLKVATLVVVLAYLSRAVLVKELRVVKPTVAIPVLGYLSIYALSTALSISPSISLFDQGAGYFGLMTLANMVLLYFLVVAVMGNEEELIRCLKLFVVSSSFVAVVGILQFYGISLPTLSAMMGHRASSIFGNPDFLFSFLVLPIPIAAGFALKRRWLYILPVVLLLYGLLLSLPSLSSRSSSSVGPAPEQIKSYVANTATWGSGGDRLYLMKIALETVPEHPLLGSGPDTFQETALRHAPLEYVQRDPMRAENRVHNEFLESLATTGILGLILYIFALAAMAWYFLRWLLRNRHGRNAVLVAAVIAAAGLYIGQSLLVPHTIVPYSFFWLLMGIGIGLCGLTDERTLIANLKISDKALRFLVVLFVGICGFGVYLALAPFIASVHYSQANGLHRSGPEYTSASLAHYREALDWDPHEIGYYGSYAYALLEEAAYSKTPTVRQSNYAKAMQAMDRAVKLEPQYARIYYVRAEIRFAFDPASVPLVVADLNRAIELYPNYFLAHRLLARIEGGTGDFQKAIDEGNKALLIIPKDTETMSILGENYISLGKYDEAISILNKSVEINSKDANTHYLLGLAYEKSGRLDKAREEYNAAIAVTADFRKARDAIARLK